MSFRTPPCCCLDLKRRRLGTDPQQFSQQVIVENELGACGNIAAESVARATADSCTLLVIGANNPINSTLYDKLGFNLLRNFAPVAGIYHVYQVMVVNPTFPAKTVPEFIAGPR